MTYCCVVFADRGRLTWYPTARHMFSKIHVGATVFLYIYSTYCHQEAHLTAMVCG